MLLNHDSNPLPVLSLHRTAALFGQALQHACGISCIAVTAGKPVCKRSWEAGSYGYHGDDGMRYAASGKGEEYGPRFGAGDTVGACLHLGRQEIFFT